MVKRWMVFAMTWDKQKLVIPFLSGIKSVQIDTVMIIYNKDGGGISLIDSFLYIRKRIKQVKKVLILKI